jgi:hypothetical protein
MSCSKPINCAIFFCKFSQKNHTELGVPVTTASYLALFASTDHLPKCRGYVSGVQNKVNPMHACIIIDGGFTQS